MGRVHENGRCEERFILIICRKPSATFLSGDIQGSRTMTQSCDDKVLITLKKAQNYCIELKLKSFVGGIITLGVDLLKRREVFDICERLK